MEEPPLTSYEGSNYPFESFLFLRQKRCVFVTKQGSVSARISIETGTCFAAKHAPVSSKQVPVSKVIRTGILPRLIRTKRH